MHKTLAKKIHFLKNLLREVAWIIYTLNLKIPCFIPTCVIPAQARIHKTVVLLQIVLLNPRFRRDDTRGKQNKVSSVLMSIAINIVLSANNATYAASESHLANNLKPLTLNQAIEIALNQHPDILSSKFRIEASQEEVTQVQSKYFPQISGDAAGVYAKNNIVRAAAIGGITSPHIVKRVSYGIVVNQMITDFGRTSNLASAAKSGVDAKIAKSLSVREGVIFNVTQAYYNQLRAQEILKVVSETLRVRSSLFEKIQLLYQEKLKAEFDVSIAKQSVDEANLLILTAQNDWDDAQAELSQALGYGDLKCYSLTEKIDTKPYTSELDPLLKIAKQFNPELVTLKAEVLEKKFQYESAQAENYPTVNVIGYAGMNPVRQKLLMDSSYATAGVAVDVPIFTGGLITAKEKQKLFEMKALEKELIAKENQIMRDVRQAWNNVQSSYQNIGVLKELFLNNIKALELAQASYEFGLISIVDLIQEQLRKTQAEISFSTARYDYLVNCALLNLFLGNEKH